MYQARVQDDDEAAVNVGVDAVAAVVVVIIVFTAYVDLKCYTVLFMVDASCAHFFLFVMLSLTLPECIYKMEFSALPLKYKNRVLLDEKKWPLMRY